MSDAPPDISEFNAQAALLIEQLGAAAFCALPGQMSDYTLFVEGSNVIAESRGAPRHPYGVSCEINAGLSDDQLSELVTEWLDSGEAYQAFLGMNVCRYNC